MNRTAVWFQDNVHVVVIVWFFDSFNLIPFGCGFNCTSFPLLNCMIIFECQFLAEAVWQVIWLRMQNRENGNNLTKVIVTQKSCNERYQNWDVWCFWKFCYFHNLCIKNTVNDYFGIVLLLQIKIPFFWEYRWDFSASLLHCSMPHDPSFIICWFGAQKWYILLFRIKSKHYLNQIKLTHPFGLNVLIYFSFKPQKLQQKK